MNWLQEAFLEPTMVQAVIIISLVSALGLYLGRIKIFGISLVSHSYSLPVSWPGI